MMLSLLPLLVGASLSSAAPPQSDWVTFGEIKAFGQTDPDGRHEAERTVAIRFPKSFGMQLEAAPAGFAYDGGKVVLNEWGNLGHVRWGVGGWAELKELYDKAQKRISSGSTHAWKVKAILFTRTDMLRRDDHGVLVPQDSFFTDPEVLLVLESFARFEAFVEAATGGAVDIQTSFSLENDPCVGNNDSDARFAMPAQLSTDYYCARFNRGDYDSVFAVVGAAEAFVPLMGVTQGRTNGATQSRILFSNGAEGGERIRHTEELVRQFAEQVRMTAGEWGYGPEYATILPGLSARAAGYAPDAMGYSGDFGMLRDYLRYACSQGMWAKVGNRTEPDDAAAYAQTKLFSGTLTKWSEVAADPWAGLPIVTLSDIASKIGATSLNLQDQGANLLFVPTGGAFRTPIRQMINPADTMLDNQLSLEREGLARIGYADRDLLLVRWDLADFVISHLGDHAAGAPSPANVMGILMAGSLRAVVVDTKLSNDTLLEANLLDSGDTRSGVAVLGKGMYNTGEAVTLRFGAESPDARFAVTDSAGNGVVYANGSLQIPNAVAGVHFLTAVAALPSGERIERPFVVRVVDPISIDNLRFQWGKLRCTLTNNGGPRAAAVHLQLPAGWTSDWGDPTVSFAANETKAVSISLTPAPNAGEGPFGVTLTADVSGSPGSTARVSFAYPTADNLVANKFETGTEGWDVYRWDSGGYRVANEPAGGSGSSLAIQDSGGSRWGKVTAYGKYLASGMPDQTFAGYSLSDYPYVNFSFRSDSIEPLAITFTVNGVRRVAMITGATKNREALPRVQFIPDGTWQKVSYNLLAALGNQPGQYVTDIAIGSPREENANDYQTEEVHKHWIDDFRISKSAGETSGRTDDDAELNPVGDLASANPYLRALGAAMSQGSADDLGRLRELLKDTNNLVRTNAAAAFSRIKDPASVPALIEAGKLERIPYPAVMFVRALAFQDTPETWDALQAIIRQGRAEEMSVSEAAQLMAATKDPKYIEGISILMTGRSWMSRRAGVLSLAAIPGEPAARMMMTFLMEVDPMVRLAVAQNAKVDVDPVGKRMEWGSINDQSNLVRAYDYVALTKSADPLLRSRGYAGIKEDDIDIRKTIAAALRANPMESHVAPLLSLVSDPSPEVRAEAVESLFAMPGQRSFSEISVLAGENQDAVLYPLLEAARAKKVELPRSMLERLLQHRNPLIRDTVKELIG